MTSQREPMTGGSRGTDPLAASDAGSRAASGGAIRIAGYLLGSALAAAASILILRYLGVNNYGRYATVISLGAIATGVTDAGLTLVGQREYVAAHDPSTRRKLASDILGIRLLLTPGVVVLLVGFAAVAGYPADMVEGTAIVGVSVLVANVSLGLTIPMVARLRFGAIAAVELFRQVVIVAGNAALVIAAGSMTELFSVQVVAASCACALACFLTGRGMVGWPLPNRTRWIELLREAAPMGLALIVGALYLRALLVLTSLVSGPLQTGLFAASNRIIEVLVGIPGFVVGAGFPLMVRAAYDEPVRLRRVLQLTLEISVLIGSPLVILLVIAPGTVLELLGGHAYVGAAAVLRIQALSLFGSFVSVVWTTALVVIRRQSALLTINVVALLSVVALGGALIQLWGARGAALASVGGEILIAAVAVMMLVRSNRALAPSPHFMIKHAPAWLAAGAVCLIPGVSRPITAIAACVAYTGAVVASGGLPSPMRRAITDAVRRRVGV